jgi:hypothetical protein
MGGRINVAEASEIMVSFRGGVYDTFVFNSVAEMEATLKALYKPAAIRSLLRGLAAGGSVEFSVQVAAQLKLRRASA